MALPSAEWIGRHRRLVVSLFVAALAIAVVESFLLYGQAAFIRENRVQSDKSLAAFLEGGAVQSGGGPSVHVRLQNVRFKWSDKVYIDTGNMAVRAVPVRGTTVNFDDLDSFRLVFQQSEVLIRPDVLAGMFNESIFNYPESPVHELEVSIARSERGVRTLQLRGKIHVVAWIPFTMSTHLGVDTLTNTLVITVDHLKVFGVFSATSLIKWGPLNLDHLIPLPPNKSLVVDENRIMVKPFGLFPPPRINGKIASVQVGDNGIRITFSGDPIPAPESSARNYVYLRGGTSQFGRFRMDDTDVLILDQNQANPFVFSLLHFAEMIPRSNVEIHDTKSARITMPDY